MKKIPSTANKNTQYNYYFPKFPSSKTKNNR